MISGYMSLYVHVTTWLTCSVLLCSSIECVFRLNTVEAIKLLTLESVLIFQGCGIGPAKDRSRPAEILIPNWSLSRSAAFDIKVIHSLNNSLILYAGQTSGASAAVGEQEKLGNNALGCLERGWMCPSRSGGIWRLGNHCKRNILKNC